MILRQLGSAWLVLANCTLNVCEGCGEWGVRVDEWEGGRAVQLCFAPNSCVWRSGSARVPPSQSLAKERCRRYNKNMQFRNVIALCFSRCVSVCLSVSVSLCLCLCLCLSVLFLSLSVCLSIISSLENV